MTWRKWLPILVGMVMLFSCESDDDTNTGVFRMYVPDGFITENEQYWIILSDESGSVLDWKPLQNAGSYSYTLPASINGVVTMTTVSSRPIAGTTGFHTGNMIRTYTGVPAGTYKFDLPAGDGGGATSKAGYLELSGFSVSDNRLDWIYPQGMLTDTSDIDNGLKLELTPYASKTALLAIVRGEPELYLYTEIEANRTILRSEDDFTPFTTQTIGLPQGTALTHVEVTGSNAYGAFPYFAGASVEVPTVPAFDSYVLTASLVDPVNNLSFNLRLTGALPDKFPTLDGSVESFSVGDNTVSWKTSTTSLDAVNILYSKVDATTSLYWWVIGDGGEQSVALPVIPNEIPLGGPTGGGVRSFTTLAKDGVDFSLLNFPHYNGYQDYLRKHYLYTTDTSPQDYLEASQFVMPE
jgi:hypothetical protein